MPNSKVSKAVVCPECGELGKAEIYTSVNATVYKGLRDKVLEGDLFAWVCPACGHKARLTYPILYNDMKNRFMVYMIPKIDRFQLCDKELEKKYSNLRNISKRIVPDFNSFKEKIFIFESGLDDMAVELTKVAISQTVSKSSTAQKSRKDIFRCTTARAIQWALRILPASTLRTSKPPDLKYTENPRISSSVLRSRIKSSRALSISTTNGRKIFSIATSVQSISKS